MIQSQHYVTFQLHPKLRVDLDYLRRRSVWVDLTILLRTIAMFFRALPPNAQPSVAHTSRRCPSSSVGRCPETPAPECRPTCRGVVSALVTARP